MYQDVLIISDNLSLCKEIEKILLKKNGVNFSFSISPFSNFQTFAAGLKSPLHVFNLKDGHDVETISTSYDLIISIHCKQLFPDTLINKVKCINVHPGYNPVNRGWYPQVFSIINDEVVGATIHEIDEEIDHGNIIDRELVVKEITDTSGTLYDKILQKEIELFKKNIDAILSNNYNTVVPESEGKLFLKKDFNNLCHIDLEEVGSFGSFINRMRALTHKDFKNAFFIDPVTNEKVYISLNISK